MPLSINEQLITNQLSQAIMEMREFLLDKSSSNNLFTKKQYENIYNKINTLIVKANTEGWFDYKHNNPHKTLDEFLDQDNADNLIIKYYSLPPRWKRVLIKQPTLNKIIKTGQNLIGFLTDNIAKIIRR